MQFHPPTRLLTEPFWAAAEGWNDGRDTGLIISGTQQRGGERACAVSSINWCQRGLFKVIESPLMYNSQGQLGWEGWGGIKGHQNPEWRQVRDHEMDLSAGC